MTVLRRIAEFERGYIREHAGASGETASRIQTAGNLCAEHSSYNCAVVSGSGLRRWTWSYVKTVIIDFSSRLLAAA
jgi:hypothetical protein